VIAKNVLLEVQSKSINGSGAYENFFRQTGRYVFLTVTGLLELLEIFNGFWVMETHEVFIVSGIL
jgi:hypothetical protein